MSDTWKLVPVEPDKLMLVKGENALHSSSHGDFHATEGEIEACYLAMLEAAPAPPVPADVQEIMRLMNSYIAACTRYFDGHALKLPLAEKHRHELAVEAAFKPLESTLTALVDDNHRLKFELDGVRAMRGPLTADEVQAVVDLLKPDHDGSDFEPECPACTAYQKLTSTTHGIEPEQGENHG